MLYATLGHANAVSLLKEKRLALAVLEREIHDLEQEIGGAVDQDGDLLCSRRPSKRRHGEAELSDDRSAPTRACAAGRVSSGEEETHSQPAESEQEHEEQQGEHQEPRRLTPPPSQLAPSSTAHQLAPSSTAHQLALHRLHTLSQATLRRSPVHGVGVFALVALAAPPPPCLPAAHAPPPRQCPRCRMPSGTSSRRDCKPSPTPAPPFTCTALRAIRGTRGGRRAERWVHRRRGLRRGQAARPRTPRQPPARWPARRPM